MVIVGCAFLSSLGVAITHFNISIFLLFWLRVPSLKADNMYLASTPKLGLCQVYFVPRDFSVCDASSFVVGAV